jgi:hypothetical protein
MGLSLRECSFRRRACAHTVQLAKHIDDEDIEYVACAILPLRSGTGVKLLRHLLIDPKTAHLVGDGKAHFRHTLNGGPHQVYVTCFARTEIHINGLPCPCFVFHGNFDPDGVCQFHLVLFGFQAEGELVKAELQDFRKPPNTFRAVASKTKIEILGGARRPREAQFHGDSAFQVIGVDDTFLDGALQNAAKCEKRDPTAKPFLIETLLASHTRKSFLQPLYRLRSHELTLPHFRFLCPFRVCVSIETASEC